jgi:D-glycero-D-manno-heptose 1,7-bisphosphate phosphatase
VLSSRVKSASDANIVLHRTANMQFSSKRRRLVFLDRDGTINEDLGYVHRVSEWKFIGSAVDALLRFHRHGFALAIVSNQSGVGSGRYSVADVDALHAWVIEQLKLAGVPLSAVVYCPHAADSDCQCRKPRTGLAAQVEELLNEPIDYAHSWVIGDKPSDVGFGAGIGAKTVLLKSRYWKPAEVDVAPTLIAASLYEAADLILARDD